MNTFSLRSSRWIVVLVAGLVLMHFAVVGWRAWIGTPPLLLTMLFYFSSVSSLAKWFSVVLAMIYSVRWLERSERARMPVIWYFVSLAFAGLSLAIATGD